MSRGFWDSVVETSTSTGTGDFVLAGAVTGYQQFSACLSVNDRAYVLIEAIDGNGDRTGDWEVSDATYSAANTITRTRIIDGTNFPSAVNFGAGTKRVSLILPSTAARFRGALVYKSADQTAANYTTATAVSFDAVSYDNNTGTDISLYSAGSPTVLTVPDGVSKVRISAHVYLTNFTASKFVAVYIYKNGVSTVYAGQGAAKVLVDATDADIGIVMPAISVVAGDYFEVYLQVETDTSITVNSWRTWFAMEIVE
jgi:hypothetical protein